MIYLLTIIFLLMLVICYFLFDKEIATPSVIFCLAYFVGIFCACLNITEWGIKLSTKAFLILVLGAVEFVLINYIVFRMLKKRDNSSNNKNKYKFKEITVHKGLLFALIIYDVIILFLLYKNVLSIADRYGEYNSFSEALTIFKDSTSYKGYARLPSYLTILMKPIVSGAYVALFVFLNNIFSSNKKIVTKIKSNLIYLIFPVLYIIQRLMESNRGSILNLCVSSIVLGIILWSIKHDWKKKVSIKSIFKLSICAIFGLVIFYYSASFVGRINNKNLYRYITFYVGGSIECFNKWVQTPDKIESFRGEYTFPRTINDLNKLHITNKKVINDNYSKFVYYKGKMVGNIYTAYRSWLHDFGIIGIIILQAIFSFVMSYLYYMIRYQIKIKLYPYMIILYSYLSYTIFMHPIDSYFYLETFTKATLFMFVLIVLMVLFINNYKKIFDLKKSNKEKAV